MPVASVRLVGEKQLKQNLTAFERKVLPRAKVNAINRTATKGRKDSIHQIALKEKRKKKSYRSLLRVTRRARVKVSELAIVVLFERDRVGAGELSKPFNAFRDRPSQFFRRRIPGKKRSKGRPSTSSPNLPIYKIEDLEERNSWRARTTQFKCKSAMRLFYPVEIRAQLKKLLAKHVAKISGA